jgi:molecular chaperone DnaK
MAATSPIIGIDLGTTNSCCAVVKDGKPFVIPSREGHNTVPSVVALNHKGKLLVGHPAKAQILTNPEQTIFGGKRLVGRPFNSPIVEQIKHRFHYPIIEGPGGEAAVKLGDMTFTLQEISSMILKEVKEIAQNHLGTPVTRAVVTCPAFYNDNQRQAVREAGALAGLEVMHVLNEPTAAALAFGYGRNLSQKVLVYDLGGGTFDASLLELNGTVYEVLATGGDTFLGGVDFDNRIVDFLLRAFHEKSGRVFNGDRVAMQRIVDAAERAKCALSEQTSVRVHVPFVTLIDDVPYDIDATLTREQLYGLTTGLIDRTLASCKDVLSVRGFEPKQIDEVLLVGGQSRMPLVHEKLTAFFGRTPHKGVHPDEAVALGAAILAHSLQVAEGITLIDVLPMSVGLALPGGRYKPVIPRNTPLPHTKSYKLRTTRDNQTEFELVVYQGEAEKAADNEFLGTVKLTGLPKAPKGMVELVVGFTMSGESALVVSARELSTRKVIESSFKTRRADVNTPGIELGVTNPGIKALPDPDAPAVPAAPAEAAAMEPAVGRPGLFARLKRMLFGG